MTFDSLLRWDESHEMNPTTLAFIRRRLLTAFTTLFPCMSLPQKSMTNHSGNTSIVCLEELRRKVLILTGPTSVGKSAIALELCRRLRGEVISADSVQLYRYLDVGSNKATPIERRMVPHHMIDVADPWMEYTAGDFFRAARNATNDVLNRNCLPVVVGGTMMYVRWYIHGRPATPPPDDLTRERVDRAVAMCNGDWDAGIELLTRHDPQRAEKLTPNDWYRLTRALQIVETTGKAVTDIPLAGGAPRPVDENATLDFDFRCIFLIDERIKLNRRIDHRCELMVLPNDDTSCGVSRSILEEVCELLVTKKLLIAPGSPCLAIGYRQTIAYLVGRALDSGAKTVDATEAFRQFLEAFQQATRAYARQQIKWFRKEPLFHWVQTGSDAVDEIETLIGLEKAQYKQLMEQNRAKQQTMKDDMISQGKQMKTYIAQQTWLIRGSIEESRAIKIAENCAQRISNELTVCDMQHIFDLIVR